METQQVVVGGVLRRDGTLELREKPDLPPGPVRVALQALPEAEEGGHTWEVLVRIWASRKARGAPTRSAAEIDASIKAFRDEFDEGFRETEELQASIQRAKEQE